MPKTYTIVVGKTYKTRNGGSGHVERAVSRYGKVEYEVTLFNETGGRLGLYNFLENGIFHSSSDPAFEWNLITTPSFDARKNKKAIGKFKVLELVSIK